MNFLPLIHDFHSKPKLMQHECRRETGGSSGHDQHGLLRGGFQLGFLFRFLAARFALGDGDGGDNGGDHSRFFNGAVDERNERAT